MADKETVTAGNPEQIQCCLACTADHCGGQCDRVRKLRTRGKLGKPAAQVDEARAEVLYRCRSMTLTAAAKALGVSEYIMRKWVRANHPERDDKAREKQTRRDKRFCESCIYYRTPSDSTAYWWCEYLLTTGTRRPCPAGELCTVRTKRKRGRRNAK